MCSRSAVKTGRPPINRRTIERPVSKMGKPKETTGMATATRVGAFCAPCRASALNMNPMKRLPQSPRKIVAGLKLKRRKPRIEPARASAMSETRDQSYREHNHGGKKSRTRSQPIKSINEVKSIRDGEDPQRGKGKTNKPGKMMSAKNYGQVVNAETAGK